MEVQVRVNTGGSVAGSVFNWKVISPRIVTWPVEGESKKSDPNMARLFCEYFTDRMQLCKF